MANYYSIHSGREIDEAVEAVNNGLQNRGATFTPSVSYEGDLSWTNDGGLENPETVNIKGPRGAIGPTGPRGKTGKTAYEYAQDGGFTGTEAEFAQKLAAEAETDYLPLSGGRMEGRLFLHQDPVADDEAATRQYVKSEYGWTLNEAKAYTDKARDYAIDTAKEYHDLHTPGKLANPKALTFSGAVGGSYDGSEAVEINIPFSGGFNASQYGVAELFNITASFTEALGYEYKVTDKMPGEMVVGYAYTVKITYDTYSCVAQKVVIDGVVYTALGNLSAFGVGDDTGESFAIIFPTAEKGAELGWYAKIKLHGVTSSITSKSISVTGEYEIITRIEDKYMPLSYYGEEIVDGYFLTRQIVTFDENGEYKITEPLPASLTVGDTYKIRWNGMLYQKEAEETDILGSQMVGIVTSVAAFIQYPAAMATQTGVYAVLKALDASLSMETSVNGPMHIVKQIDKKYIPGSAGSYVIPVNDAMLDGEDTFIYPGSYDDFAGALYYGGNVWVDTSGTSAFNYGTATRFQVNMWAYEEGSLVLACASAGATIYVVCTNGTLTPPIIA